MPAPTHANDVLNLRREVRRLRRSNRQLRQRSQTAYRLVDNVSHDFRTPLTVIKEYSDLLHEGLLGELTREQQEFLQVIGDRAEELNQMVDDLLDISKLRSGMVRVHRRPCRLDSLVLPLLNGLEQKAAIREVALYAELPSDPPRVFCDPHKFGRVLTNLMVNAIKFATAPGEVRLRIERLGCDDLQIRVTDNGPGIAPEDQAAIFSRFRQLESSGSVEKGFGLGLSIANELCDLNLGRMTLESEPGQGSTFSFTVPLDHAQAVAVRLLSRLEQRAKRPRRLSLFHAEFDATAGDVQAAADLLGELLSAEECCFPQPDHSFKLLLYRKPQELSQFSADVERCWTSTNRNRPFEPLPVPRLNEIRSWPEDERPLSHAEDVMQQLEFGFATNRHVPIANIARRAGEVSHAVR